MAADEAEIHDLIIIKRRANTELEQPKGGVWKIAFADFMTAMMCFFLVMWLINAANEDTRKAVASYFNPVRLAELNRKGLQNPHISEDQTDRASGARGGGDEARRSRLPGRSSPPSVRGHLPRGAVQRSLQGAGGDRRESEAGGGEPAELRRRASELRLKAAAAGGVVPRPVRPGISADRSARRRSAEHGEGEAHRHRSARSRWPIRLRHLPERELPPVEPGAALAMSSARRSPQAAMTMPTLRPSEPGNQLQEADARSSRRQLSEAIEKETSADSASRASRSSRPARA